MPLLCALGSRVGASAPGRLRCGAARSRPGRSLRRSHSRRSCSRRSRWPVRSACWSHRPDRVVRAGPHRRRGRDRRRAELARRIAPIRRRVAPIGARLAQMGGASRARPRPGARAAPPPAARSRRPARSRPGARSPSAHALPRSRAPRSVVRGAAGAVPACPRLRADRAGGVARCACPARPGTEGRARPVGPRVAGGQPRSTSRRTRGRLLPTDRVEARDLASIERETGTPGDVNVIVRSERLLDPAVVRLDVLLPAAGPARRTGSGRAGPVGEADLCPALSLTNLFGSGHGRAHARSARPSRRCHRTSPRT